MALIDGLPINSMVDLSMAMLVITRGYFFPHEFPSAEGMSSAQENLQKHLQITWPVERPWPAKGFGTNGWVETNGFCGQSLMKCAFLMCQFFMVILVLKIFDTFPISSISMANSIFFTHQSYHKKGAVVGKNFETRGPQCLMTPPRQWMTVCSVRLTPISSTSQEIVSCRISQLNRFHLGPNMEGWINEATPKSSIYLKRMFHYTSSLSGVIPWLRTWRTPPMPGSHVTNGYKWLTPRFSLG